MFEVGAESFTDFYVYIMSNPDQGLSEKIVNAITINETMWFRDQAPWKVLEEHVLPQLVDDIRSGKKNRGRIWSAAVSTGQEIYSTVMCVDNYLEKRGIKDVSLDNFEFIATDIAGPILDIAKHGRYDKVSIMRGLDDYYKMKYFAQSGSVWDIDPRIRDAVRFERFNLQNNFALFGTFDVIFCRYVLIYFSEEFKKAVIKKLYHALASDGVLFTGNYVLYELFKDDFESMHYENLTYFTKQKETP